jgi:uncharacterized protein (DUF433 family)
MKHDRITVDPKVLGGKPVITGTRVPVEKILRELGNGLSYDDILREYPRLTRGDILAAQRFAADDMQDFTASLRASLKE